MSKRVLFNGAVLVRPGASTKIDASQFQNIALSGLGVVGLIGEADSGESRTVQVFTSPQGVKNFYRSGDLVEAAQMVADPGNDPRIPAGAQTIVCYKVNNSTKSTLAHGAAFVYSSVQYGLRANNVKVGVATDGGSGRIITITDLDDFGVEISEVSPTLGLTGKFTIQYVGAGSACTITISATTLTTSVTAGPGGENLAITFADWNNLGEIIRYIDGLAAYTCSALVTNVADFDPTNLDALVAADIRTALTTIYSRNFDLSDWVNSNSSVITAALTKGQTGPMAALTTVAMAGGTRGTSASSNWVDGFTALRGTRINQMVPLASADATTAQGTFTVDAILAALVAHCKYVSSTVGRNECQGWAGVSKTKANLIVSANTQNSEHVVLLGQKAKRARQADGDLVFFSEWSTACLLAGMRAGAPLGEPLTWKFVNCLGLSSDSSWKESNNDDVSDLTLNGLTVINEVKGKGFRIDKCITTFTKFDNDAYTEETIVQIWKAYAFDLRSALETKYVGRPGNLKTVKQVPGTVTTVSELYVDAGALTGSVVDGKQLKAYRNITYTLSGDQLAVGVTISPTPGINFVLGTIVLVPASISG